MALVSLIMVLVFLLKTVFIQRQSFLGVVWLFIGLCYQLVFEYNTGVSNSADSLSILLEPFGLSAEESGIYLHLLESGGHSALGLSKCMKLPRTRVYRILDRLVEKGMAVQSLADQGSRYEAASPQALQLKVLEQEKKAESLKNSLPLVLEELGNLSGSGMKSNKVLYYSGQRGLLQVTHNSLRAKGELLTMEISDMNAFMDQETAEELRREFVKNKIKVRTITNLSSMDDWTEVTEMVKNNWQIRHLPESLMKIQFEVLIYNNVYVLYQYNGGDVFCVEIYNQKLVDQKKQIFEFMWRSATPMQILSPNGKGEIETN